MDKQKGVEAWHRAERRLLKKYAEEYDQLRFDLRMRFHAEKAKNDARRQVIKNHYAEFRQLLTEEKKGMPDSRLDALKVRIALLRVDGVPDYIISGEIERMARTRAKILLRNHHYPEYKDSFAQWRKQMPSVSDSTIRNYADDEIFNLYKDEYSKFLVDAREYLLEAVG